MTSKKVIAFFGGVLYEEKNYSFMYELGKLYSGDEYLLIAFSFSNQTVWMYDMESPETILISFAESLNLAAIIMQLEYIRNDTLTEKIVEMGHRMGVPVIAMERPYPGCINVKLDHKDAFKSVVQHVVKDHGCRDLFMIAGIKGERFSEERIQAFREVLEENGIAFSEDNIAYGNYQIKTSHDALLSALEHRSIPKAIICASDQASYGVCEALRECGKHIPEDVIVTGYDGISSASYHEPSITSVAPDFEMEAALIAEQIAAFDGHYDDSIHSIGHKLCRTESCGCKSDISFTHRQVAQLSDSYYDVNWAVSSMNNLILNSATIDNMTDLSTALKNTLWFWDYNFQFVGVKSALFYGDSSISDDKYVSFFRHEKSKTYKDFIEYDYHEFVPDFDIAVNDCKVKYMSVRLLHIADKILGYVMEGSSDITHRNLRRVEEYGMFLSSAINSVIDNRRMKALNSDLENASKIDFLTGISNRRGFYQSLDEMINDENNEGRYLTLLSIDMDNLKKINDSFGHEEGDYALKQVAYAIKYFVNENGTGIYARYGGDEYACAILTSEPLNMFSKDIDNQLTEIILRNKEAADKSYTITTSVGQSSCQILDKIDVEQLLRQADHEMYENKRKKHKVSR